MPAETTTSVDEIEELTARAIGLAAELGNATAANRAGARHDARFAAMVSDPVSRRFVIGLADEVVRVRRPSVALRRLRDLLDETGTPSAAGASARALLRSAATLGALAPGPTVRLLHERVSRELGGVVLDGDDPALAAHLSRRRGPLRANLHLLGEAVLGEREGDRHTEAVVELLRRPDVADVSVKLSGLCARSHPWSVAHTVAAYRRRLTTLLEVAAAGDPPRTVHLDMERFEDLAPTAEAFVHTLSQPAFRGLRAGIALQAYLPDSLEVASGLCAWAARRREAGGAPVRIRLVKGANLGMEHVEAELHGWQPAPYADKAAVDANYKRVLAMLLDPGWGDAVEVGLASHNLFEVAWGITLAEHLGARERLEVEMLEGMATGAAEAVAQRTGSVLLYAPVVRHGELDAAVAYLARRLEESIQPGNFLTTFLELSVGDEAWVDQELHFRAAVAGLGRVRTDARRDQDRSRQSSRSLPSSAVGERPPFANVADTDFTRAVNRAWASRHLAAAPRPAPAEIEDTALIDELVASAGEAGRRWSATGATERARVLSAVAEELESRRGELVATIVHEVSKVVPEADVEVSEAIDFARWYAAQTTLVAELEEDGLRHDPYRTVVVAGPWNFPVSIPAGSTLAALAAGCSVVLKPAPEAQRCAAALVECLHAAGVPEDLVGLAAVPDGPLGRHLVTHPAVDAVSLTGSLATARVFLDWDPELALLGETSGLNAMVVTDSADLDQAVSDVVRSAFGHAGQKCSAASLLICTAGVYDDERFRRQLADAVTSLRVGSALDPATEVPDLVQRPGDDLRRALTRLDAGEEWLVEPACLDGAGRRWSPGVRLGVLPGSFCHRTECFGPVLGVMRAPDLDTAIRWQNDTGFALTGGIHSLDIAELRRWCAQVEVGNVYVNRSITGAVVRRQPFGGWKASSVGPGAKAGGPNTVLALGRWSPTGGEPDPRRAAASFDEWWDREFGVEHDPSSLTSEANVLRYVALPRVVLRLGTWHREQGDEASGVDGSATAGAAATDAAAVVAVGAATVVGAGVEVSLVAPRAALQRALPRDVTVVVESDEALAARLAADPPSRLRLLGSLGVESRRLLNAAGVTIDDHAVCDHGRVELLHWLAEQSISVTLHRHGTLEPRFRDCLSPE